LAFKLNPQLEKDSIFVMDLDVCQIRLMNDSRYMWLILIPREENAIELHDLPLFVQGQIFGEITIVSKFIKEIIGFDKINIGALGNVVSQLHIHVIGRKIGDAAWPAPVWNNGEPIPYNDANKLIEKIRNKL
jgi:diadenosine tetraphosphate (Ap4A) HIT family hydrolase